MRDNLKSNEDKKRENRICLKVSAFTTAVAQRCAFCVPFRCRVHPAGGGTAAITPPRTNAPRAFCGCAASNNSSEFVYGKERLFAGDAVFDEVRMLQTREFDGEAVLDVTDHAPLRLADGAHGAD